MKATIKVVVNIYTSVVTSVCSGKGHSSALLLLQPITWHSCAFSSLSVHFKRHERT